MFFLLKAAKKKTIDLDPYSKFTFIDKYAFLYLNFSIIESIYSILNYMLSIHTKYIS